MKHLSIAYLCVIAAVWAVALYAISCLISGKLRKLAVRQMLLYISTLAMLGPIAEISFDSVYVWLFGHPLWNYTIFPIYHAYTSFYAPVVWGLYGFYLYLFHGQPGKRKSFYWRYRLILFSLEALAIEGLANLSFKLTSGHYIYYYFPADLWHLTSLQALPFSFLGKYFIDATIATFGRRPLTAVATCLAVVTALLAASCLI